MSFPLLAAASAGPVAGDEEGWTPDYELPGAGEVVALEQTNTASSVYPAAEGWTTVAWIASNLVSFGGGVYIPTYSPGGAWVNAGTGGHNHADNHGALGFDFTTRAWFRLDNANGVPRQGSSPWSYNEVTDSNGSPYYEVTGSQVPLPPHPYASQSYVARGDKGSIAHVTRSAVGVGGVSSHVAHIFDLATRLWSRLSTNAVANSRAMPESDAMLDVERNRIWFVAQAQHNYANVAYLDLADDAFKVTSNQTGSPPSNIGTGGSGFWPRSMLHDGLILRASPTDELFLYDPDDPTTGWIEVAISGTLPQTRNRWAPYNGKWYSMREAGGNTLDRITPPVDPKGGTWVVDTVEVDGPTMPAFAASGGQHGHYELLFAVPVLGCLAYLPGGDLDVYLLKPE